MPAAALHDLLLQQQQYKPGSAAAAAPLYLYTPLHRCTAHHHILPCNALHDLLLQSQNRQLTPRCLHLRGPHHAHNACGAGSSSSGTLRGGCTCSSGLFSFCLINCGAAAYRQEAGGKRGVKWSAGSEYRRQMLAAAAASSAFNPICWQHSAAAAQPADRQAARGRSRVTGCAKERLAPCCQCSEQQRLKTACGDMPQACKSAANNRQAAT